MNNLEIDKIITKVFQNKATDQDLDRLSDWLNDSPVNQKVYDQLFVEWNKKAQQKKAINEEELIDKIWDSHSSNHILKRVKIFPLILKVAAVILLLVTFAFLYQHKMSKQQSTLRSPEVVIKENKAGQKSRIFLTDGSVVWLNSNSSIIYTKEFRNGVREVEITGEAYFEIVPDTTKPFIVKFGETTVKVLGTSFNISDYPRDGNKVISLVEGKISLIHQDHSQVLTPGWIAEINSTTNKIKRFKGDISTNLAWTRDELVFNNASYDEIFSKLERWYGKKIQVVGNYETDHRFNGTFKSEYLTNVLENLISGDNMSYEIVDDKVILTFK